MRGDVRCRDGQRLSDPLRAALTGAKLQLQGGGPPRALRRFVELNAAFCRILGISDALSVVLASPWPKFDKARRRMRQNAA